MPTAAFQLDAPSVQPDAPSVQSDDALPALWAQKVQPNQHEVDIIYEQMLATIDAFTRAGVNYHLVAGSALGQARNGGLIPWDDDVDFGIHRDDADRVWAQRHYLSSLGYGMVRADIGFKMGTGALDTGLLRDVDGVPTAVGPGSPFAGVNQDIFFFHADGEENGVPVMRYSAARARLTWPKEVIPTRGWFAPTRGAFGGYELQTLPAEELDWYLAHSYGADWKTHNGAGEQIVDMSCALHTSKQGRGPEHGPGQWGLEVGCGAEDRTVRSVADFFLRWKSKIAFLYDGSRKSAIVTMEVENRRSVRSVADILMPVQFASAVGAAARDCHPKHTPSRVVLATVGDPVSKLTSMFTPPG